MVDERLALGACTPEIAPPRAPPPLTLPDPPPLPLPEPPLPSPLNPRRAVVAPLVGDMDY